MIKKIFITIAVVGFLALPIMPQESHGAAASEYALLLAIVSFNGSNADELTCSDGARILNYRDPNVAYLFPVIEISELDQDSLLDAAELETGEEYRNVLTIPKTTGSVAAIGALTAMGNSLSIDCLPHVKP